MKRPLTAYPVPKSRRPRHLINQGTTRGWRRATPLIFRDLWGFASIGGRGDGWASGLRAPSRRGLAYRVAVVLVPGVERLPVNST